MKIAMRFFVISILMLAASFTKGQGFTPSRHAFIADSTGRAGNVDEAIAEWKLDYALSHRTEVAYTLAQLYSLKEDAKPAFEWLYIALEKDSSITALCEGDLIYLSGQTEWNRIENQQIEKSEARQGKYKKLALSKKLWYLQMKDQAYTTQWSQARRKLGVDHPVTNALQVLFVKVRAENAVETAKIIDEFGWPKISVVGESAATSVFYIIQHAKPAYRKKYLPKLKAACKKKEAPWLWYATMYDRMLNDQGKKQCYGTQFTGWDPPVRLPIEAPGLVNERRQALGLEPLQEFIVP